ncbi:imelysin family protein [Maribacter sp. X9]|uniref:imelysin family protein n=1 Tax=Maribacter sp. X9 TaxID=3402159 RepID=UPI003AF3525F
MRVLVFALSIIVLFTGCSSDSGDDNSTVDPNYNKEAMLVSWADNIIIPAFTNYQLKVNSLNESTITFTQNPGTETLLDLRNKWLEAYKAYQHVGIFDMGKATDLKLLESSNTYPTDAGNIEANISSGAYNLSAQAQFASQGFPALDYMLYGVKETDEDILALYTDGAKAAGYKAYLTALSARLKLTADAVLEDWAGGYRATFIGLDNAITGSLNQMANNFIKNLEKDIRAPKVGIPAGIFSNGTLFPDKVEGYYSNDISKELLLEATKASQNFFKGASFGTNGSGPGLNEFLDAMGAKSNGQSLSGIINGQYATIFSEINKLDNSFSQQISADNSLMVATYNAFQQNVVYLKVDMISALSLTIDYVDGDGD